MQLLHQIQNNQWLRCIYILGKYGIFLHALKDQNFYKIKETRWLKFQENRIDSLISFKQYLKNSKGHNLANYSSKPNQFQIIYWVMEPLFLRQRHTIGFRLYYTHGCSKPQFQIQCHIKHLLINWCLGINVSGLEALSCEITRNNH